MTSPAFGWAPLPATLRRSAVHGNRELGPHRRFDTTLAHPALCRHEHGSPSPLVLGVLDLADQRQHPRSEVLDLLLEVQEAAEDQVHAPFAVRRNAFRNLLGRADE